MTDTKLASAAESLSDTHVTLRALALEREGLVRLLFSQLAQGADCKTELLALSGVDRQIESTLEHLAHLIRMQRTMAGAA